ncbi:hypothetical protein GCM10017673_47930 [Streptosporangium violaceochromogenes]|nr:hypothetical protein GCM10017673_47930 [Streptosporangium violaceochromogenes]
MDHSDHTLLHAGGQTAISDRMRELLARAAQDHMYEQRTQGAVLDEIRRRLEGVEWLLREVRERELSGMSGTLESVHGHLSDIAVRPPAWAEGLAQHVEAVRDHVDVVGERVGSLGRGVDSVRDRVVPIGELPSLWADIGAVGESVDEALTHLRSISDGTRGVDDRLDGLTGRLGHVLTGVEAAAGRFTRLDRALGELGTRTGRLETETLALAASLREAVGDVADRLLSAVEQANGQAALNTSRLEHLAAGLGDRLDRVNDRLEGIDGRLAALDGRASALEGRMAAGGSRLGEIAGRHETRFDVVEERLDDIEGRIASRADTLDSRLRTLDGCAEKAAERLESVDERLTQAHAALTPLAGLLRAQPDREQLAEALTRMMEPARMDITRRLGALEETMLALAEALLRPARGDD